MKRLSCLFILALLIPFYTIGQVKIVIAELPANTPANDSVYIAGDFNNWDPGNTAYRMVKNAQGKFEISLNLSGNIAFKFTRGSWNSVEGSQNGGEIANRTANVKAGDSLALKVLSWKDLNSQPGTALPTVKLLDDDFFMPQLNTNRRIWICLPPDYETNTSKYYPVLYMQDGQNLFDVRYGFGGNEWKVDETLKRLFDQGDPGVIVVGIDNGGVDRIKEYTPWVNQTYESGQGSAYAAFLSATLKPYIDQHYRTLTTPQNNALMGSSLGGLISLYTMLEYPDVFGKAGVLSPAFWINKPELFSWQGLENAPGKWVYLIAGSNESSTMVSDMQQMRDLLLSKQVGDVYYQVVPGGNHNEQFWASVFGQAYTWLFRDHEPVAINPTQVEPQTVLVFPCSLSAAHLIYRQENEHLALKFTDITGKSVLTKKLLPGTNRLDLNLPAGIYLLSVTGDKGTKITRKIFCNP